MAGALTGAVGAVLLTLLVYYFQREKNWVGYSLSNTLDHILRRWLVLVRKHVVAVHLGAALVLLVVGHLALSYLDLEPSLPHSIAIEVGIVFTSLLVPPALTALSLRREIRQIIELTAIGPARATEVVLRWIMSELKELIENVHDLTLDGVRVTSEIVPHWVRKRCWESLSGRYIGVDSNVPSKYMSLYKDYLSSHQEYIDRTKRRDSVRIILATEDDIRSDYQTSPSDHNALLKWHEDHSVKLKMLKPQRAAELADHHKTGDVLDMAAWDGELVLVWKYDAQRKRVTVSAAFVGSQRYERCMAFLAAVEKEASPFPSLGSAQHSPTDAQWLGVTDAWSR